MNLEWLFYCKVPSASSSAEDYLNIDSDRV